MLRIIKIMADYNKDVVADRERDRHPMATSDGEFEDYETRMSDVIRDGYENCDPERWLKVIPQLIANIDMQYVNTLGELRVLPKNIIRWKFMVDKNFQRFSVQLASSMLKVSYFHLFSLKRIALADVKNNEKMLRMWLIRFEIILEHLSKKSKHWHVN